MAEGHGSGPAQCQRPGESAGRQAFRGRLILGTYLPKGPFPHLYPERNEPVFFQGPSGSEKFCDVHQGLWPELHREWPSRLMESKACVWKQPACSVNHTDISAGGNLNKEDPGLLGLGSTSLGPSHGLLAAQA